MAFEYLKQFLCVSRNVRVGERFKVGVRSRISAPVQLKIGDNVSIGRATRINGDGQIGNRVKIGDYVTIIPPQKFCRDQNGSLVEVSFPSHANLPNFIHADSIYIEDDVRIEHGAIILGGITVSRGAIIRPGAVVTSYVAPYTIVVGNPAVPVGQVDVIPSIDININTDDDERTAVKVLDI
jgi:acetyltransferase-like isoleucine patch superfamily enzyme